MAGMSTFDVSTSSLAGQVLAPAGANLVLAEWTAEGATGDTPLYQAPLHLHEDDEAWYVLDGVLRVRVGTSEVEVSTGGAVLVPGGTPHTFWNPTPRPTRYLLVMGARTYALIQEVHAGADREPEAMRRLFERHGARLLE
jgi:mannose-6-phosphate isomerase-like protein (cupin superfamily)